MINRLLCFVLLSSFAPLALAFSAFNPISPARTTLLTTSALDLLPTTNHHYWDDLSVAASNMDVSSSSTILMAATEPWVQPMSTFLDIGLNLFSFAMLCRVVLSWYPTTKITDFPWIAVVLPTEPLLRAVKGIIPPAFGVDVTPVFWLAIFTFVHEILVGQQGLLTLKIKYGI